MQMVLTDHRFQNFQSRGQRETGDDITTAARTASFFSSNSAVDNLHVSTWSWDKICGSLVAYMTNALSRLSFSDEHPYIDGFKYH